MPFIQDKIVGIDGWYAWVVDNTTYYTKSKTPSVGDIIYNENKEDSGKTISAVGDGYIEFEDTIQRTITVTNDDVFTTINEQFITYDTTETLTFNVGDLITIQLMPAFGSMYDTLIRNSSNTNYIPNGSTYEISFIMPNEDLSFETYAEMV